MMISSALRPFRVAVCGALSLGGLGLVHASPDAAGQWGYRDFFDHVEKAAGFPRFSLATPSSTTKEIRILHWAPTAMIPMSALRLVEADTGIQAQLVVAWHADVSPGVRKIGASARCDPDDPRAPCVEVFEPPVVVPPPGQDWMGLFHQLLSMGPCEDPTGAVVATSDAGDLVMHIIENGRSREYYCNAPGHRATPAGQHAAALLNYLDASVRRVLGR